MLKISIAICTYNGEKFLQKQLDSFAMQTRLADEVIICDDCSKDSTQEILTAFAESAVFPVKLYFNEQNLNFLKNFEKTIKLCTGDVIVLSDQDDVWHPNKLELIENEFAKSEKIGMVYADAEIVDEFLCPSSLTMWQQTGFSTEKQDLFTHGKAFDLLLTDGYVYGSSMAFRSIYRDLVLPFPQNTHFIHDNWIALMISAVANVALIKESLIKYRQHQSQSVGIRVEKNTKFDGLIKLGQRLNEYDGTINQLEIAEKKLNESNYLVQEATLKIAMAKKHVLVRANLPNNVVLRLFKVGQELIAGNYHRYYNGFRSAIKDLLT